LFEVYGLAPEQIAAAVSGADRQEGHGGGLDARRRTIRNGTAACFFFVGGDSEIGAGRSGT